VVTAVPGYLSTESLQETINSECKKYNKWLYIWLSFYIVLDALLIVAYVSIKKLDTQHALLVGIFCTTLGLFGIFIHALTGYPLKGISIRGLARFFNIFTMPLMPFRKALLLGTVPDAQLVAETQAAIVERAETERFARHWLNRMPAVVVLGGFVFVAWLVYHIPILGIINFVAGMVISQTQFYTQPAVALRAVEDLEA
jgi:hypothetical protein